VDTVTLLTVGTVTADSGVMIDTVTLLTLGTDC